MRTVAPTVFHRSVHEVLTKKAREFAGFLLWAEEARFELAVPCDTPVFKTGALNHYATPPRIIMPRA